MAETIRRHPGKNLLTQLLRGIESHTLPIRSSIFTHFQIQNDGQDFLSAIFPPTLPHVHPLQFRFVFWILFLFFSPIKYTLHEMVYITKLHHTHLPSQRPFTNTFLKQTATEPFSLAISNPILVLVHSRLYGPQTIHFAAFPRFQIESHIFAITNPIHRHYSETK